ncbi:hypothetical protein NMY22_g8820 [Coprinellus aureogranulatus]|nr:hypothetical protein NMY22_g8820 [Coprinellus aureogranulatus]
MIIRLGRPKDEVRLEPLLLSPILRGATSAHSMDIATIRDHVRSNVSIHPDDRQAVQGTAKLLQDALPGPHRTEAGCSSGLLSDIDNLKKHIAMCQSLIHPPPISTIPPEILSHIFTLTSEPGHIYVDLLRPPKKAARPAIYTLTRVCRHWRAVAQGTVVLWDHEILVNWNLPGRRWCDISESVSGLWSWFDDRYREPRRRPDLPDQVVVPAYTLVDRLDTMAHLYGHNLTRLSVDCRDVGVEFPRLIETLLAHRTSLVTLNLLGEAEQIFDVLNTFDMPHLEELFTPCISHSPPGADTYSKYITFKTPRLRKLFLHNRRQCYDVSGLCISWTQITHLSLGHTYTVPDLHSLWFDPTVQMLSMLEQLPNLVSLHLCCVRRNTRHANRRSVTLHKLERLEFHGMEPPFVALTRTGPAPRYIRTFEYPFRLKTPSLKTFDLILRLSSGYSGWCRDVRSYEAELVPSFYPEAPSLSQFRALICSRDDRAGTMGLEIVYKL